MITTTTTTVTQKGRKNQRVTILTLIFIVLVGNKFKHLDLGQKRGKGRLSEHKKKERRGGRSLLEKMKITRL